MSRVGAKVILTSGRTLLQGRTLEDGKLTEAYQDAVSYIELDSTILEALDVGAGDIVEVETIFGTIDLKVKKSRGSDPGVAFIPCGPYANAVTGEDTQESGMPAYKSIEAQIFKSKSDSIRSIEDMIVGEGGA